MSGEVARWIASTPAQRTRSREVAKVRTNGDIGVARVGAIGQVSQAAMLGTLNVSMMKREAALLVPEDAAKFDLVATQAAIAMAGQINWVSNQW
jgi:hypothetical protein